MTHFCTPIDVPSVILTHYIGVRSVYSPWGTTNYFDDTAKIEDSSFVYVVHYTNSVDGFEDPSKSTVSILLTVSSSCHIAK